MKQIWLWIGTVLAWSPPEGDRCTCVVVHNESVLEAMACAERPLRPWTLPFATRRCELWCCAQRMGRALGWSQLASHWARKGQRRAWEPILGSSTLATFADGVHRPGRGVELAPSLPAGREVAVIALSWSTLKQPNLSEAASECMATATALGRSGGCLLIAAGDAAFPPRGFEFPQGVRAWATNVAVDAPPVVSPAPLGVSAGPNRRWVRTIRGYLADGEDARLDRRETRFFCRGYRVDDFRRAALADVAAAFPECAGEDRAPRSEYWRRLLAARATFCPRGLGVATFRVYEALLAGSVPVLETHAPHAGLFTGMPVVQIPSFALLTPSSLDEAWRDLVDRRRHLDLRRSFAPYWIAELARISSPRLLRS